MDYIQGTNKKGILLIYLEETKTHYIGLDARLVPDSERLEILKNKIDFECLTPKAKIEWIKKRCPSSYKNAFKTLNKDNCIISSRSDF